MLKTAIDLTTYLNGLYTEDGLWDSNENSILPNKYGNSFYALACTLLYKETGNDKWKTAAKRAVVMELINTKNRFRKVEMFRWEFKNYALLKVLEENIFDKEVTDHLVKRVKSMQNLGSFKTNWMAMRGLNLLLRGKMLRRKKDIVSSKFEIKKVLERQTPEGLFQDDYNNNSFQYHAYMLALLVQYYEVRPSRVLKARIVKGLEILKLITDPSGNCNYFGRGQQQIFGYCAAVFAFSFAHKYIDKDYGGYAKLIFSYIEPFLDRYRIVANSGGPGGWYKYNYLTDYLPFAAVYLIMSHRLIDFDKVDYPKPVEYELFLENSNLFIKRTKEYFVCVCAGNNNSSELPGLVHMYPSVIPCSGGPPINMEGKDYTYNFLGVGKENILAKSTGKFIRNINGLKLFFERKDMDVTYVWEFGKDLKFKSKIMPKLRLHLSPIHYVSWEPLDDTESCGDILTPMGKAKEFFHKEITIDGEIEREIVLYSGSKIPKEIIAKPKPKQKLLKRRSERYKHFIGLSSRKIFFHPRDFLYSLAFMYTRNNYKRKRNILFKQKSGS